MKLTKEQIERISDLTDRNFHTNARLLMITCISQDLTWCNREILEGGYKFIEQQHSALNWLPDHLSNMRRSLDELLKDLLFQFVENAEETWGAL